MVTTSPQLNHTSWKQGMANMIKQLKLTLEEIRARERQFSEKPGGALIDWREINRLEGKVAYYNQNPTQPKT